MGGTNHNDEVVVAQDLVAVALRSDDAHFQLGIALFDAHGALAAFVLLVNEGKAIVADGVHQRCDLLVGQAQDALRALRAPSLARRCAFAQALDHACDDTRNLARGLIEGVDGVDKAEHLPVGEIACLCERISKGGGV